MKLTVEKSIVDQNGTAPQRKQQAKSTKSCPRIGTSATSIPSGLSLQICLDSPPCLLWIRSRHNAVILYEC